jgi:hypothetical protein
MKGVFPHRTSGKGDGIVFEYDQLILHHTEKSYRSLPQLKDAKRDLNDLIIVARHCNHLFSIHVGRPRCTHSCIMLDLFCDS